MSAGDLLLVPLLLLGLLKNRPEDAAEAVMGTVATLASSLLVLFLTWLLVTRLDGGSLSDLRLRAAPPGRTDPSGSEGLHGSYDPLW